MKTIKIESKEQFANLPLSTVLNLKYRNDEREYIAVKVGAGLAMLITDVNDGEFTEPIYEYYEPFYHVNVTYVQE